MPSPLHRAMTAVIAALGHPASLGATPVATPVPVAMTLAIQRGQNRDTMALQARLDELIPATDGARNDLAGLYQETQDDIEEIRNAG